MEKDRIECYVQNALLESNAKVIIKYNFLLYWK